MKHENGIIFDFKGAKLVAEYSEDNLCFGCYFYVSNNCNYPDIENMGDNCWHQIYKKYIPNPCKKEMKKPVIWKTKKAILNECFLGVIDFNETAALSAMEKYARQEQRFDKTFNDSMAFAMWLTGHNKETIEQMYKDWKRSPYTTVDNGRFGSELIKPDCDECGTEIQEQCKDK